MLEFQCHYREEKWLTPRYFKFVEDFFNTANSSREVEDCEPPPCPTTIKTKVTTTTATAAPTQQHSQGGEEILIWHQIRDCVNDVTKYKSIIHNEQNCKQIQLQIQIGGGLLCFFVLYRLFVFGVFLWESFTKYLIETSNLYQDWIPQDWKKYQI